MKRGRALYQKAENVINGERQNQYGNPEDAFSDIAVRWNQYLSQMLKKEVSLDAADVAFMMSDFKMARQCHQHKEDNLVDAVGYLGMTYDLLPPEHPESKNPVQLKTGLDLADCFE